jgi:hypothetical protein
MQIFLHFVILRLFRGRQNFEALLFTSKKREAFGTKSRADAKSSLSSQLDCSSLGPSRFWDQECL